VLITRPAGQAAGLQARLRELGSDPVLFPTLAILPPAASATLTSLCSVGILAGQQTFAGSETFALTDYHLAIFVSPTAVQYGLAGIPVWPMGLRAAG